MSKGTRAETRRGGFSLVKVLVSLILLGVGLFAVAQLFLAGSRVGHDSLHRTVAEIQAVDMGERMWMDLANPLSGVGDWQAAHEGSLPGWKGTVEKVDTGSPDIYRIRVAWRQQRVGAGTPPFFDHFVHLPRLE